MTYRKPARPRLNPYSPLSVGLVAAWGFAEGHGLSVGATQGRWQRRGTFIDGHALLDLEVVTDGYTWVPTALPTAGLAIPGYGLKNTTNGRSIRAFIEPWPEPNFSFAWVCDFNIPATITRTHFQIARTSSTSQEIALLTCSTAGLLTLTDDYGTSATSAAGALTEGMHTVVYTRTGRASVVYVDGKPVISATASGDPTTLGDIDVRWGSSISGANGWFETIMYGAAVWDRALSEADALRYHADPFEVIRRTSQPDFGWLLVPPPVVEATATAYRKPARPRFNPYSALATGLIAGWGFEEGHGTKTRAIQGAGQRRGTIVDGHSTLDIAMLSDGYDWVPTTALPTNGLPVLGYGLKNTTNARALRARIEPRPEEGLTVAWFGDINVPTGDTRTHFHLTRTSSLSQTLVLMQVTSLGAIEVTNSYGNAATSAEAVVTDGFHSFVYSRTGREQTLYVDGVAAISTTDSSDITAEGLLDLRWGTSTEAGDGWLRTILYTAAAWDRALSADDALRYHADPFEVIRRVSLPDMASPLVIAPPDVGAMQGFAWDQKHDGWWEDSFNATTGPTCLAVFDADDPDDRVVAVGCADGYLRVFDKDATTDDGLLIESRVVVGPFASGLPDAEARFSQLQIILATDQDEATFEWYVSQTPDLDFTTAVAVGTGTAPAGLSQVFYTRARGLYVWLAISGMGSWAYEAASFMAAPGGRARQRS